MHKPWCIYLLLLFTGLLAVGKASFLSGAAPDTGTVTFHIPVKNQSSSYNAAPANGNDDNNRRRLQTGSSTISGDSGAANGTSAPGSDDNSTTNPDNDTSTDNTTDNGNSTDNDTTAGNSTTTPDNSTTGTDNSTNSTDNSTNPDNSTTGEDNSTDTDNTTNSTNSTDNNTNTAGNSNATCTNNSDGSTVCINTTVNCVTNPDDSETCTNITSVCEESDDTTNCTNITTQSTCMNDTDDTVNCTNTTMVCVDTEDGEQDCTNSTTNYTSSGDNSTSTGNSTGVVTGDNGTTTTNTSNSSGSNSSSNSGATSSSASCATNPDGSETCTNNTVVCSNSSSDDTSTCANLTNVCTTYDDNTVNCTNTSVLCTNNTDGTTNCTNNTVLAFCVNNTDGSMLCTDDTTTCANNSETGSDNCANTLNICQTNPDDTTNCTYTSSQVACVGNDDGSNDCTYTTMSCLNDTEGNSNCTIDTSVCVDSVDGLAATCTNTTVICITDAENGSNNCSNSTGNNSTGGNMTNTTNTTNGTTGPGLPDGTQVDIGNCDQSCQSCFGPSKYECNGCYSNATLVWIGTIGICAPKGDSAVSGSGGSYQTSNLSICTPSTMNLVDCARLTEAYLENLYLGHYITYVNGVQTIAIQANSNSDICMTCMQISLVVVNQNLDIIPIPYAVVASTSPVGTTNYTFITGINNSDLAGFGCNFTQDENNTKFSCDMQLIFTALNTTSSYYDFSLVVNFDNNVIADLGITANPGGDGSVGGPTGSTGDNSSEVNVTQHNNSGNCLSGPGTCQTNVSTTGTINLCADLTCTSNKTNNVFSPNDTLIIKQTIYDLEGFNFTLSKDAILALDANGDEVADLTSDTNQTQGLLYVIYSIPLNEITGQVTFSITSIIVAYNPPSLRRHLQGTSVYLNSERTTKFNIIVDPNPHNTNIVGGTSTNSQASWWIIGAIAIGALIIIAILIICVFQMKKNPKKAKKRSAPTVKFDPVMTVPNRV